MWMYAVTEALCDDRVSDFTKAVSGLDTAVWLDENEENLLHQCARDGAVECAAWLLGWEFKCPAVNQRNIRGEAPLHIAITAMATATTVKKHLAASSLISNLVANHGADILVRDNYGITPFRMIGQLTKQELCPPNVLRAVYAKTVHIFGKDMGIKLLVENGWNISSSFHIEHIEFMLCMLDLFAPILKVPYSQKPHVFLHEALRAGSPPSFLIVLLQRYQLNVNAIFAGHAPLHIAVIMNVGDSYYEHIKTLLEAGANPNLRNKYCLKPIHYTLKRGNPKIFELLVAAGSELPGNIVPYSLHYVAANGHTRIMQHIIPPMRGGLDVLCEYGLTPLMCAARNRHAAAVYLLLAVGADVNKTGKKGMTALHHAIMGPDKSGVETPAVKDKVISVIGLLLHFGANVDITNHDNQLPLQLALKVQNAYAIYLLVRHIALHKDREYNGQMEKGNEFEIELHKRLSTLYHRCQQELKSLRTFGHCDSTEYVALLRFDRRQLIELASGEKAFNHLLELQDGGVAFVNANFSPTDYPIYGTFLLSRFHHANIELMTKQEIESVEDDSMIIEMLALSAPEFVEFFNTMYLG